MKVLLKTQNSSNCEIRLNTTTNSFPNRIHSRNRDGSKKDGGIILFGCWCRQNRDLRHNRRGDSSVHDLKVAIKTTIPSIITREAVLLELFLAETEHGGHRVWLESDSDDVKKLKKGEITPAIQALTHEDNELQGEDDLAVVLSGMDDPSTDQIHVLVFVPECDQQVHDSDAELGEMEILRLERVGLIIDAATVENEEAFWSAETQLQADAIGKEAVFNAFITPFFSNILHSHGLVFVNSESYPWLSTENRELKPAGFATHRGMYCAKPVPDDGVQRPNGFRFGVAEEELFDCLILFQSKLTITNAAFGQVVRWLEVYFPDEDSAILFDRCSFWLITYHKSVVVKVQKAMWINKGSKPLFQNFITDNISPWVKHLTNACFSLNVDVVDDDSFLGRGAYGRVFKVTGQDQEVYALKIVENCSVDRLYLEEEALNGAQHTELTVKPVGKVVETAGYATLLLSPVGEPLPRPKTRDEIRSLFGLLWQLHANGLVHGDARVPNVIVANGKPLWIDFASLWKACPVSRKLDAEMLTRSILNLPRTVSMSLQLKQLIDNYGKSATRANLNVLAE